MTSLETLKICLVSAIIWLSLLQTVKSATSVNTFETKLVIDAGSNSCFYFDININHYFYIEFSTTEYDDGSVEEIGFEIAKNGKTQVQMEAENTYTYEDETLTGGTYMVCFNNVDSYNEKHILFTANFYRHVRRDNVTGEFDGETDLKELQPDMMHAVWTIETDFKGMIHIIHVWKTIAARNLALVEDIAKYVSLWSAVNCFLIMMAASMQVYFVRKLFDSETTGKTKFWFWLTE